MVKKFVILPGYLVVILFFISCGRNAGGSGGRNRAPEGRADATEDNAAATGDHVASAENTMSQPAQGPVSYSVYIENSESMDGYVSRQGSDFNNTVHRLLTDLRTREIADTINLNYVNDNICPYRHFAQTSDVADFMNTLTPDGLRHTGCARGNSFMHKIIHRVISVNPSDVDILISDYIFSTGHGPSVDLLNQQRDNVKGALYDELRQRDFSTIIVKFNSGFDGKYFIESRGGGNNSAVNITGKGIRRPYYMMIFGHQAKMRKLIAFIKSGGLSAYDGYEEIYSIFQRSRRHPAAKLIRTNRRGDFRIEEPATRLVVDNAKEDDSATFQCAVAMDLDSLPLDEKYLMDKANYQLPANYQLVKIEKNDDPENTSLHGFTHIFIIRTSDLKTSQDVYIRLKSREPHWVEASTILYDDDPANPEQQKKTFGFQYLVDGIKNSYEDKYPNMDLFEVNAHISKNEKGVDTAGTGGHSSLPWIILIGAGVLVAVIIGIKNKR